MADAKRLRQLEYRHNRRIASAVLKTAYVLLRQAAALREFFLRQLLIKPDPTYVSADELAHIHEQAVARMTRWVYQLKYVKMACISLRRMFEACRPIG